MNPSMVFRKYMVVGTDRDGHIHNKKKGEGLSRAGGRT